MTRKIAYLTGEYPRATDTFIQREVAALRACGLEINTCSIRRTGPEHLVGREQRTEAGGTYYVLPAAKNPWRLLKAHIGGCSRSPRRYINAIALAFRTSPAGLRARLFQAFYFAEAGMLADHLHRSGIEHLHNHIASAAGTVAMLASEMAGIPFSFTLHGPGIFYEPHHWRLDEKIKRADFVACISNFARAQAMNFSSQTHWDKLKIIHCGVDPLRYSSNRKPGKHVLFVGRLAAVKGVPLLLEALAKTLPQHPETTLTLIGDGSERAGLEAQAVKLGLNQQVHFAGYQSQDEVAQALSAADIFVLPSFAEGVPVVLMEAMATGLPVIATAVGGVSELVENGESGLLLPPGDVDALVQALGALLSDPKRRAAMGKVGAIAVAQNFDSSLEAAKLAALLRGGAS